MCDRFIQCVLTAGICDELKPEGIKKNLLCGILDIAIVRGDIDKLKEKLENKNLPESPLKWVRFMPLSQEPKVYFAIKYSNPFKNDYTKAVYDIELVKAAKQTKIEEVTPQKGILIKTAEYDSIETVEDLFTTGCVRDANDIFSSSQNDIYLAKDLREGDGGEPLNELHLLPIVSQTMSIKTPKDYKMASSTQLTADGGCSYLIKRYRPQQTTIRYKADVLSVYPSLSEGACINSIKMLFPEGVEFCERSRKPQMQSCYIAVNESSLDKHMLTFVKFTEPVSEAFRVHFNMCNFTQWSTLYVEKAIGLVSSYHDNHSAEKILKYLYEYILAEAVPLPIERIICNLVDELYICNDRPSVFTPQLFLPGPTSSPKKGASLNKLTSQTRLLTSVRIPSVPIISLKRLFRVLSIESVILLFKNLLLERGVYLIGRNPRTAFDIIEASTSIIYPLKWELPKILSYEADITLFNSPMPIIYYFNSEKFKYERISSMDMSNKVLVFVDSNDIKEYSEEGGLSEIPSKLLEKLAKNLEKTIGAYNRGFLEKKASLSKEEFESLLEKEDDIIAFDYWKIREIFFDFMNELLDNYRDCYKEAQILENKDLGSSNIFDFAKFLKIKSSLKHKSFCQNLVKTSIFSRFIECRILPETTAQEIYYNCFDSISQEKWADPKCEVLRECITKAETREPLECIKPNNEGIDEDIVFGYCGSLPLFDQNLFIAPRDVRKTTQGLAVEDFCNFLNPTYVAKRDEEKWARCNLEILFTVWLTCLRVSTVKGVYHCFSELVSFAFNRFIELEVDKVDINSEMIKSLAFLLGVFNDQMRFQKLFKKNTKVIDEHGQSIAVYSDFLKGTKVTKKQVDPSLKHVKYSSGVKKRDYTEEQMQAIDLKDADEYQRDNMIPLGVKSHFETNTFCSKCGTYIPEEIILARIQKDFKQTRALCPNQACNYEYEPFFSCLFLKEIGPHKTKEAIKLQSPLRLFIITKEFLETREAIDLFDPEVSGDLYWNLLFYFNFMNLPSYFMDLNSHPHIEELNSKMLHHFTFGEKLTRTLSQKKSTLSTNLSGNESYSLGEAAQVSDIGSISVSNSSPGEKLSKSASAEKDEKSNQPKFIFKKDFYKRLEGYEDKIKKSTPINVLKIYFKYCEEMRNFEKKSDIIKNYISFLTY